MKIRVGLLIVSIFSSYSVFGKEACDLRIRHHLSLHSFDSCSQEALDEFYVRLAWGTSIPRGFFQGKVQLAKSHSKGGSLWKRLRRFVPAIVREQEEFLMERFWRGKVFYAQKSGPFVLWNRVLGQSEAFPAYVYVGPSLFDSGAPSLVIDYRHNQDIEGYRPGRDWFVGLGALAIRDEIREVRPGLYLGRAYVRGRFFLNFVLEQK